MAQNFRILAEITEEPPALPPLEHAGAHILNTPLFERKFARVYLGEPNSRDALELRKHIAKGARKALEDQYWDIMERTIQARPMEAELGGDPSPANKVRAFVAMRHYRGGEWDERIEVRIVTVGDRVQLLMSATAGSRSTAVGQAVLPRPHRPRA